MTNTLPFQAISGGKSDDKKPPTSNYNIYHVGVDPNDIILSEYTGYSIATELMFYVVDADMNLLFLLPMSRLVYVEATPNAYIPTPDEIN